MRSGNEGRRQKIQLKGAIAQMGERLICIQEVRGSIPRSSTTFYVVCSHQEVRHKDTVEVYLCLVFTAGTFFNKVN